MILVPHASRKWLSSNLVFLPLAAAYLCLLIQSWTPDTLSIIMPGSLEAGLSSGFNPQFFPKLEGIAELFSRPSVAASWLLHVMVINLFAAKTVLLEGEVLALPCPALTYSLCLTADVHVDVVSYMHASLLMTRLLNIHACCPYASAGVRVGVPTAHSILLCALLGPLGWLSHQLTRALVWAVPSLRAREGPVQLTGDKGGTITLLPYCDS